MRAAWTIAKYTFLENMKSRIYMILLLFGGVLLVSALLMGALAPGHKTRVIMDMGLLVMELFGLATVLYGAVTMIQQDMESKTIYILVSRPMRRSSYVVGKFAGLLMAVSMTVVFMAFIHLIVMLLDVRWFAEFVSQWNFWSLYPAMVLLIVVKITMIAAVALFFSLFATSPPSALMFTISFWVAGHFNSELEFLIAQSKNVTVKGMLTFFSFLLPNFQYFNLRDSFAAPLFATGGFLGWALLYGLGYTAVFLFVSVFMFSKKEY